MSEEFVVMVNARVFRCVYCGSHSLQEINRDCPVAGSKCKVISSTASVSFELHSLMEKHGIIGPYDRVE